ncbi:MAG: ECF transporter S component [Anaerolineae bacterium]|nr:ECF transporter S component [Anaerolineae bacterium]
MKRTYFTIFELVLLTLFSALVVVAKIALRLPIQLPGHSGLFWMALVVAAAGVVPKRGAASLVGLTSGILAAFLGLGDFGALNTLLSYTLVGVGADLALWLLRDPENVIVAALTGALGHLAKFLVKWVLGIVSGAPLGFVALGLAWSLVNYLFWGALGGLLGGLTLKALRRAGFFAYVAEKR